MMVEFICTVLYTINFILKQLYRKSWCQCLLFINIMPSCLIITFSRLKLCFIVYVLQAIKQLRFAMYCLTGVYCMYLSKVGYTYINYKIHYYLLICSFNLWINYVSILRSMKPVRLCAIYNNLVQWQGVSLFGDVCHCCKQFNWKLWHNTYKLYILLNIFRPVVWGQLWQGLKNVMFG